MVLSHKTITGTLAMWAVRQSPYAVPDKLAEAVVAFGKALNLAPMAEPMEGFYEVQSEGLLFDAINAAIHEVPEILAWNERKNGNPAPYKFVSRFDSKEDPDNDFIDLGALARNTAASIWREAERNKAFDDDFDRRWKAEHPDA